MSADTPAKDQDKFVLRLPDGMRDRLKAEADANKRSMNAEIVARLEGSFRGRPADDLGLSPGQQKIFEAMQEGMKEAMRDMILRWDASTDRYPGGSLIRDLDEER